jgi:predicted TIM-barrel fold metal-dependent hydrolase
MIRVLAVLSLAGCTSATDGIVPYADYHVHLLGPYAAPAARFTRPVTAERLIADLDKAGIKRALVLSEAFWIVGPGGGKVQRLVPAKDQATAAQLENDWTAAQVARYPDRLVMACGINPLDAWALAEFERCSKLPVVRAMKLNVSDGGDDIDLHDAAQVKTLRDFFAAANARHMPIVIHLGSRGGFGRAEVRTFLRDVMSAAPDIPVQIAHLSNGFVSPDALSAFADARAANDPLARNLYFDLSPGRFKGIDPAVGRFMADAIRKIDLEHVVYASDEQPGDDHVPTAVHWKEMGAALPLTPDEFRAIADNVTPYIR